MKNKTIDIKYQRLITIPVLGLIWMMLTCSLCADLAYGSDSMLELSKTSGYAYRADADVGDLDYAKDFSVEFIANIEPHAGRGRWAAFIQKGGYLG